MSLRRSGRPKKQPEQLQAFDDKHMVLARKNSMRTYEDEEQRRNAGVVERKAGRTQVFHRRKRPRQEEEEDPEEELQDASAGNDETSAKSKTMEEIVEKTEAVKNPPPTNVEFEAAGKFKSKSSKKTKRPASSTKKKKKKDVVRSYFGFSKDEPSPDGSNDEVLLVEDEDHVQDNDTPVKSSGVKFAYPSRADPEAVEVEEHHLQCLNEQEYINDTIVDVYIKYIQEHIPGPLDKFHIFNSFFFKRLAQAVCDEDYHQSVSKLRKWTKGIDIYDKQYVLMPVHQKLHWSLVVVCFSGPKPGCHILHLDSMKTGHTSRPIYEVVRRYLTAEWIAHGGATKDFKNVHEKKVKVPQQQNEYDCGLFMLHFIEQFLLRAPAEFSDAMVIDMNNWFSFDKASELRSFIREFTNKMFFPKDGKPEPARDEAKKDSDPSPILIDDAKDTAPGKGTLQVSNRDHAVEERMTNPDLDTSADGKIEAKDGGDEANNLRSDDGGPVKSREDPDQLPSSEEHLDKIQDHQPSSDEKHPSGDPGKIPEQIDDHPPGEDPGESREKSDDPKDSREDPVPDKAEAAEDPSSGVKPAEDHPPKKEENLRDNGEDHTRAEDLDKLAEDHPPVGGGGEEKLRDGAGDGGSGEERVLEQTEERLEQ